MRLFFLTLTRTIFLGLAIATPLWAKTLTICTDASPEGFDVAQYHALVTTNASADPLMNRLVDFDAVTAKIVPSLAERFEVSPDGLNYTFYLRKRVHFHATPYFKPTRPMNADDVLFSFNRILLPHHPWHKLAPNGFPSAQSQQLPKLIASIKQIDPYTVQFTLTTPESTFLNKLTMGFMSIYSAEYAKQLWDAKKTAQLNSQPIGTGPFILRGFQKDAVIRYAAHPQYFGGMPKVDRLIYAIVPDSVVRVQKLKANECQIALSPKPQDIAVAKQDKTLHVVSTPAFMTAFVALNTQHPPLNQLLVRQAIAHAFDRKAYLAAIFAGTATPADGVYPVSTPHKPSYPHDPAKARKRLAEAGFPNGFETTIWTRPSGSALNPNPKAGAELLQADLSKVGIRAQIKTVEWGELIKRGKSGEHDLLFMGWAGDSGDPDEFLTPQFSCAAVATGTNFTRHCDPQLDNLLTEALRSTDPALRTVRYTAVLKRIDEQALWIPLAHPNAVSLIREQVSGYRANPFGRQDFSGVRLR